MTIKDQAIRVAVLGALKDTLIAQYVNDRGDLLGELLTARETLGVKSVDVHLPGGGPKIATVTLTQPSGRVEITDDAAFIQWVQQQWPDQVETVTVVRPDFRQRLLNRVVDAGDGDAADSATGEIVPGVTLKPGGPPTQFSMRYTPEGRPAIAKAWRGGQLNGYAGPVLQLEPDRHPEGENQP